MEALWRLGMHAVIVEHAVADNKCAPIRRTRLAFRAKGTGERYSQRRGEKVLKRGTQEERKEKIRNGPNAPTNLALITLCVCIATFGTLEIFADSSFRTPG